MIDPHLILVPHFQQWFLPDQAVAQFQASVKILVRDCLFNDPTLAVQVQPVVILHVRHKGFLQRLAFQQSSFVQTQRPFSILKLRT